MSNKSGSTGGGIGFCGCLAIVFIILKLCHVIEWPWIWVLAPIWMPIIIALIVFFIFILIINNN